MFKSNKGVTMVALVVTIVITMLLAAVSISYTIGDGNFIQKAQEATNASRVAGVQDLFQYYVSVDYAEEQDVFANLILNGYVKKINNGNGDSVYYITHEGIKEIASTYEQTTTNEYIYQIVPEIATGNEATITQEQFDLLLDADVYFVDLAFNIAYLSNNRMYGAVYFSKVVEEVTDKWWLGEDAGGDEEEKVVIDFGKASTAQEYFALNVTDINNQGTIIGFNISGATLDTNNINGDLVIPSQIMISSVSGQTISVPVTKIDAGAFSKSYDNGNDDINHNTSINGDVYIPSSVKEIGMEAFSGQTNLKGVHIAAETVGRNAFKDCNNISTLEIMQTTKKISESAFENVMNGLTSIKFSEGLKQIGASAFKNCRALGDIVLPASLEELGVEAFSGCMNSHKKIDLSRCTNLKVIPEKAFYGCNSITSISFAEGLEDIESEAFAECRNCNVQNITFPNSLESIASKAFSNFETISGNIYMGASTSYNIADSFKSEYVSKIMKKQGE